VEIRGRALEKKGGSQALLIFFKLRILVVFLNDQTISSKVGGQKGNSPDYIKRSLKFV
jgi:hypothetical protein